jgi:hypothetical protein
MRRAELEHVLRAASQIAGYPQVLLAERVEALDVHPDVLERLRTWISNQS